MQSTGVQNLSIGLTGVKEIRGAHLSYMCLVRAVGFSFPSLFRPTPPVSRRRRSAPASAPPPPLAVAAPPQPPRPRSSTRRASLTPPVHHLHAPAPLTSQQHRTTPPPLPLRTAARTPPLPALPTRHATTCPLLARCFPCIDVARVACAPLAQTLRARKLFEGLPEPLFAPLARHVLAITSRDGS